MVLLLAQCELCIEKFKEKKVIKSLSKSTSIMFLFDLLVFAFSTSIFYVLLCGHNDSCSLSKVLIVTVVVIAGLFSLFLKGQYKIREFNVTLWNAYRLLEGVIFAHIIPAIVLFFFVNKMTLLKFLGLNICTIFLCLYIYRLGFHYYLFNLKKVKRVLVVGANERAKAIIKEINNKQALKMQVVGVVKSAEANKAIAELDSKVFGFNLSTGNIQELERKIEEENNFASNAIQIFDNGKDLHNIVETNNIDIVIFTHSTGLMTTVDTGVKVYLMPDFYEKVTNKFYIDEENLENYQYEVYMKYKDSLYDIFKRRLDIISALIIFIVTLPITGFTALRIWLTDHENPIYTQNRVGKNGKVFKCYKLRTMWANNFVPKDNKKVGYVEDQNQDDRVIPWCKFVRKARFDEIPQMINIIKGEMSIVGPRAEWTEVAEIYKKEVLGYPLRMMVNTAWTGWAQINQGHCVDVNSIIEKLQYDLYYIKHRNLFWDISILVKAVFLALGGRHA